MELHDNKKNLCKQKPNFRDPSEKTKEYSKNIRLVYIAYFRLKIESV